MALEEKVTHQMSQALGEQRNTGAHTAEVCPHLAVALRDTLSEKNTQFKAADRHINQSERKHHSEPLPQHDTSGGEERKCFERRRLWTRTKQESFDLPEELKCLTEDNVFMDTEKPGQHLRGKSVYQRSFSVPALLPDIVPEQKSALENLSPDVVSVSEKPKPDNQPVQSAPSTMSSEGTESVLEEKEKKLNFEGSVYCEPSTMPQEVKRKKSVTFETAVQLVRVVSSKGKQARSHFCSSGYGSQSDNSQVSQGSNVSSERGSIFSDDVLVQKGSLVANDTTQVGHPSLSAASTDGNINVSEEGKSKSKTQETAELPSQKKSQVQPAFNRSPSRTSKPATPEEIDEIELWQQQNVPDFHYGDMDDIPNLSIFELSKEDSGTFCLDRQTGNLPNPAQQGMENVSRSPANEPQAHNMPLATQSSDKLPCSFGSRRGSRISEGENPESKSSPTTKEECQCELFKRLFEERMLKFDPIKESISDLLEWVKKNIGEALTPSPKSPFFPTEKSQHSENSRSSPGLVAVTSALQGLGIAGGKENLYMPNMVGVPATQFHHAVGNPPPAPGQFPLNPAPLPQAYIPRGIPVPIPDPRIQGVPLSCFPCTGVEAAPSVQQQQQLFRQQQQQQLFHLYHHQQQQQQQQPSHAPVDVINGHGTKGRGPPGPNMEWQPGQMNVSPPATYQQDLPAILEDMMSSMCMSSSSDSTGFGSSLLEQLVHMSQCFYVRCTEDICVQGKKNLSKLQEALKKGQSYLSGDDLCLLNILNEHYLNCDLFNCPVPWCRYVCLWYRMEKEKTAQALIQLLSSPLLSLLPLPADSRCHSDVFVKLDPNLPGKRMPREQTDWLTLYPLSHSYTVARAMPLVPVWPHRHWVVKVACLHEEGNQVEVYKKLRDLQHKHIINHVWVAAFYANEILVICTDFLPGMSVRELLNQREHLGSAQTHHYWQQVLSAVQWLHNLNIIFLNWTCGNLLLDDSCRTVKLTNFIASVELSSGSADMGDVKLTLPGDIVPAELLVQGGEVTHRTDSWGLACVLHEMLTGTRPWYHLRHCKPEDTWLQILKQIPPNIASELPSFAQHLIHHCLQKSPEHRPSVKDMMEHSRSQWF